MSSHNSLSASNGSRNFNLGLLIPIIVVTVLLLLGGVCCCWMHRQCGKSGRKGEDANDYSDRTVRISFSQFGQSSDIVSSRTIQASRQASGEDTFSTRREAYELSSASGPHDVWRILQEDENLARKRIPYKEIRLRARVAKSQTREVRLGEYQDQQVVVKRLLKTKRSHKSHIQEFIYHIQIISTLAHPNIVTVVGVAWKNVADVMLVTKHYPSGDLLTYLQNYGADASWEHGKYRLAVGIARALVYLHSQPTPVAHRDLRASNVLLTETISPKLTGFESSCLDEHSHRSHVASAPYWSAPEVLRGRPYGTKSDIYAFGVLLTELDTASAPFHDALSPLGTPLKPIQILNEVMQVSANEWAPTDTFTFDGSSSDLALQLYTRSQAGGSIGQLSLTSIPDPVTSRLSDVNVAFDDLDGFAQRAVLWDTGFAVTTDNKVKQIWTLNGLSMAEIALTLEEYEATTCTAFECTQPDGKTAYNNNQCTGTKMLTAVKCVVEESDQSNKDLAMWSIGGKSTTIPEIEIVKHTWVDRENYTVYAIHTLRASAERTYGDCPTTESYGYLNIPCYGQKSDDVVASELKVPTPSDWVTSWVQSFAIKGSSTSSAGSSSTARPNSQSSKSRGSSDSSTSAADNDTDTNVAFLGGAVGGGLGLLLIVLLVWLFIARRKRNRSESEDPETSKVLEHVELVSPDTMHWEERRPTVSTHPRSTFDESLRRSGGTVPSDYSWSNSSTDGVSSQRQQTSSYQVASSAAQSSNYKNDLCYSGQNLVAPVPALSYEHNVGAFGSNVVVPPPPYGEALRSRHKTPPEVGAPLRVEMIRGLGPNNALKVLGADPSVDRRRLQLEHLQIERQLPMTTLQTDSFVARYNGQQVLLKRLAPEPNVNSTAVEDIAFEIQQRAHVAHPNLVQFVGAGWTSAHDLGVVVEFLPQGSLRSYLDRNKRSLGAWTPQKTAIAGGIARALDYLHRQQPAYVQHELCAKNVLLTDKLEAKLASCGSIETTPSVAYKRNSPRAFWIAPEVLKGASYCPSADIYAFGVLLTELDTCETPYFDVRSKSDGAMNLLEILALVKEGRLRPSFSADCPQFIRQLGVACCQQDPERRLTAQQIVQLLEGK